MLSFAEVMDMLNPSDAAAAGRIWGSSLAASASTKLDQLNDVQRIDSVRNMKARAASMLETFAAEILAPLGFEERDLETYRASALQAFGLALEGRSITIH